MPIVTRREFTTSMLSFGALAALPSVASAGGGLREGSKLPALKVSSPDGGAVSLSSLIEGKVALINFWATWCGPCMQELPALDGLHRKLADKGDILVLAVNVDQGMGLSFLAEFWRRYRFELPLLVDTAGLASQTFRLAVLPMTYIVDRQGVVRYALEGSRNWQSDQWVRGLEGMAAEPTGT